MGGATLTLALGGPLKESLPTLSDELARFLDASATLFGSAPPLRILAVGNVGGPEGNGGGYGPDVSFLVDEPLREGDLLFEVEGAPATTFNDLRVAFDTVAPEVSFAVTVMRDGKPTPFRVTLADELTSAPSRSRWLSVSLEMMATPEPLTLAIRQSIFGRPSIPTTLAGLELRVMGCDEGGLRCAGP